MHSSSLALTCIHLHSHGVIRACLNSLGLTWTHLNSLDSLELTRIHLNLLALTPPLSSLGLTWSHLKSRGLKWTHFDSLTFTWTHLIPLELTWTDVKPLELTQTHLDSLGCTWIHLHSLGFTWAHLHLDWLEPTWTHLDSIEAHLIHLNSLKFNCTYLNPLGPNWTYLNIRPQRGKGKRWRNSFFYLLPLYIAAPIWKRVRGRTTLFICFHKAREPRARMHERNETSSRLVSPATLRPWQQGICSLRNASPIKLSIKHIKSESNTGQIICHLKLNNEQIQ